MASKKVTLEKRAHLMEEHRETLEDLHQRTKLKTVEEFIQVYNDGEAETARLYNLVQNLNRQGT